MPASSGALGLIRFTPLKSWKDHIEVALYKLALQVPYLGDSLFFAVGLDVCRGLLGKSLCVIELCRLNNAYGGKDHHHRYYQYCRKSESSHRTDPPRCVVPTGLDGPLIGMIGPRSEILKQFNHIVGRGRGDEPGHRLRFVPNRRLYPKRTSHDLGGYMKAFFTTGLAAIILLSGGSAILAADQYIHCRTDRLPDRTVHYQFTNCEVNGHLTHVSYRFDREPEANPRR